MNYFWVEEHFQICLFVKNIAEKMRTVKECGEMKNPRAKRAKLLFFIFNLSKCSCYPLFVLLIYFKQTKNKKEKEENSKKWLEFFSRFFWRQNKGASSAAHI